MSADSKYDGSFHGGISTYYRTEYPQENPQATDTFTRLQIIQYLDEVPLGYITEQDHKITEELVTRIQRHFAELSTKWEPSND